MPDALGPIVPAPLIERVVVAHVRRWLPSYLAAVERIMETRPDGETPLEPGSVPLPRAWRPTEGDVRKWPEDQLPAVIFAMPGLGAGGPARRAGPVDAPWVVSFTTVVGGPDDESVRWLAGVYTAAIRTLMVQHPPNDAAVPIRSCHWADEAYDRLPSQPKRSLRAGACTFELEIEGLVDGRFGLPEPPEPPTEDPGVFPSVQTTGLEIERS